MLKRSFEIWDFVIFLLQGLFPELEWREKSYIVLDLGDYTNKSTTRRKN